MLPTTSIQTLSDLCKKFDVCIQEWAPCNKHKCSSWSWLYALRRNSTLLWRDKSGVLGRTRTVISRSPVSSHISHLYHWLWQWLYQWVHQCTSVPLLSWHISHQPWEQHWLLAPPILSPESGCTRIFTRMWHLLLPALIRKAPIYNSCTVRAPPISIQCLLAPKLLPYSSAFFSRLLGVLVWWLWWLLLVWLRRWYVGRHLGKCYDWVWVIEYSGWGQNEPEGEGGGG